MTEQTPAPRPGKVAPRTILAVIVLAACSVAFVVVLVGSAGKKSAPTTYSTPK